MQLSGGQEGVISIKKRKVKKKDRFKMTARKRRVWNVHQVHRKHAGPGRRRLPDKLGPKKRFMGEGRGKGSGW